jgi:hypothetical protein
MKTIVVLLSLLCVFFCAPLCAQRQCSDAQYTEVALTSDSTEYVITSLDSDVTGYEVEITIELPTPNGPVRKREMRRVSASAMGTATVVFNVAQDQIVSVEILCTRRGQS